ncbi:MAG TPA: bifunctional serine/threonine-protein kinase/formylglycine-generating enzyme family protein [Candidatus Eremiobacteraeota bacterium]|nr:bifunctional serine/threonine-protein kinase/formylglycine-generating enzyme family protein [Candidatus Eremiobacteraeota bacterium]
MDIKQNNKTKIYKNNSENSKSIEPLPSGTVLENRYKIIKIIKVGEKRHIYKTMDIKLDNMCILKELICYPETKEDEDTIERFNRGIKIFARLEHSNLPKVYDYFSNNNRYYVVMVYIEGHTLEIELSREGKPGLPEEKVILWAIDILKVLDYLHSQNNPIVFRDIKPANIMLHKDGRAMLIDFGIARAIQMGNKIVTSIGTPGYAPEEQYYGKVEIRSDIYALGASIHQLLTGIKPETFNFKPLKEVVPNISPEVESIIMKSLDNNISKRFSSAKEMLQALNSRPEHSKKKEKHPKFFKGHTLQPDMILIPGGIFQMGSDIEYSGEKPIHTVILSPFYMSKYLVTYEDYCMFLNSREIQVEGSALWIQLKTAQWCGISGGPSPGTFKVKSGYENRPVVCITWYGAVEYCNWLSEKNNLTKCYGEKDNRGNNPSIWLTNNGYRLPTESEWEYACRGGTTTSYYWGDTMNGDYCWYKDNGKNNHHRVGLKLPNSFGLYDIIGNVAEWCNDWYGTYPADAHKNPAGPLTGEAKVPRGGSFGSAEFYCRSSSRSCSWPNTQCNYLGFRLARSYFEEFK